MASSSAPPVVARLLLPDDANPAGNVHGGTILRLMEEAGMITATRYIAANHDDSANAVAAALVRFETMSFHQPAFVGEVLSLAAHVIFTSEHSVLVGVVVTAEDVSRNKTRVTNSGQLWYVPMTPGGGAKDWKTWQSSSTSTHSDPVMLKMPQLPVPDADDDGPAALAEYNKAKQLYEARKRDPKQDGPGKSSSSACLGMDGCLCASCRSSYTPPSEGRTPTESEQRLSQMVLPGDCGISGVAFGGFVMKLMDNAAGCSAFRHCRTNVVTLAISAMDFVQWIKLGDICSIHSTVTFSSARTLEIDVRASVTSMHTITNGGEDTVVAKGTFVFASIGADHKSLPVPKLKLETEEELEKAYRGQERYELAKRARVKSAALGK